MARVNDGIERMEDGIMDRITTTDDQIVLETIRQHCWRGDLEIKMQEWLHALSSESPQYVEELLQIHSNELKTIVVLPDCRYKLTMCGVWRLNNIPHLLKAFFYELPRGHIAL